jgi:hypothetical protein
MIDLEYDPASLLPPPPAKRLGAFEKYLSHQWETKVRLPAAYVEHVRRFHGGCPGKACFTTAAGRTRMVGRFFNFLEPGDLRPPLTPSWRQWTGGEQDVRLDYRAKGFTDDEFWCVRLEKAGRCLPIAGLDTAGHSCRDIDEFDLLCLDYSAGGVEPAVITWAFPGFAPVEPAAPSFEAFLGQLARCPARVVSGPADNW